MRMCAIAWKNGQNTSHVSNKYGYFYHVFTKNCFVLCLATPMGVLPMLEWDGELLIQSNSIARFLAKHLTPNLLGTTYLEQARTDMAADCIQDFYANYDALHHKWMAGNKEEHEREMVDNLIPTFLSKFEKFFFKDGRNFVAGDKVNTISSKLDQLLH